MRRGTRVVFGALVVLVAASVVFLLTDGTGEARSEASPVETPPAASTSGMELPEALPSAERPAGEVRPLDAPAAVLAAHAPSADATSAPAPARISGRVTHALDGRPAAGERLIVLWEPANPEAERLAHPEVDAAA
jgi:hypothetical protein